MLENGEASVFFSGSPTVYPDQTGSFANEICIGVFYDSIEKRIALHGIRLEAFIGAAPNFLANTVTGRSNYYRARLEGKGYLRLFEIGLDNGFNLISIFLADRLSGGFSPRRCRTAGSAVPSISGQ